MPPESLLTQPVIQGMDMPEDQGKRIFRKPIPQGVVEIKDISTDGGIVELTGAVGYRRPSPGTAGTVGSSSNPRSYHVGRLIVYAAA